MLASVQPPPSPRASWPSGPRRRSGPNVGCTWEGASDAGVAAVIQHCRLMHPPCTATFGKEPISPTSVVGLALRPAAASWPTAHSPAIVQTTPRPSCSSTKEDAAGWRPPRLQPLPVAALHPWVHDMDCAASVCQRVNMLPRARARACALGLSFPHQHVWRCVPPPPVPRHRTPWSRLHLPLARVLRRHGQERLSAPSQTLRRAPCLRPTQETARCPRPCASRAREMLAPI